MKLIYPSRVMNITQSYQGNFSHEPNRSGSPRDYPFDEACADTGRDYFYAPCDVVITKIYGVGTDGTNTIWMQSVEKVEMPCGKDFVTIMVIHPEDDDLRSIKVGQIFKQGVKMFREGKDGRATGNHFHISVAAGTMKGSGWVKNNRGAWVIQATGFAIKPEDAFYITKDVKVINSKGLIFKLITENNKATSVESPDRTKVQLKAGLDNNTMKYLDGHPFRDALYKKLADAMK